MTASTQDLSRRAYAILRAVAAGQAEITGSREPDLYIDGLLCCDQYTARLLARRNLIAQDQPGRVGQRVRARLTAAGVAALATVSTAG